MMKGTDIISHMNRSWEIRLMTLLFMLIGLSAAFFAVLFVEQRKLTDRRAADENDLLQTLRISEETRKKYYETVAAERESLRQQMAASKSQYDSLVAKQPDLVKAGQQQVTKMVTQTVPVQVPVTTRSTKTS